MWVEEGLAIGVGTHHSVHGLNNPLTPPPPPSKEEFVGTHSLDTCTHEERCLGAQWSMQWLGA